MSSSNLHPSKNQSNHNTSNKPNLPNIYADVDFNETFIPSCMSVMAVSKFTHVKLPKHLQADIRLLDRSKQLQAIHTLIQQHYTEMTGNIPFEGVIKGYYVTLYYDMNHVDEMMYIPADFG